MTTQKLITDADTNFVYFSAILKKDYPNFWERLEKLLTELKISYGLLENTKDIWCRDYMPIQITEDTFFDYIYNPDYLNENKEYEKIKTNRLEMEVTCNDSFDFTSKLINRPELILDGGNVIKNRTHVFLTKKIFTENLRQDQREIITQLEKVFNDRKIIILPRIKGDCYGHIDWMVRVFDDKTLLVNNYEKYRGKDGYGNFIQKMETVDQTLTSEGFTLEKIPYVDKIDKIPNKKFSALYLNYLQVGEKIILPVFNIDEDKVAENKFEKLFGKENVFPLESAEVARKDGALNCISWTIKK